MKKISVLASAAILAIVILLSIGLGKYPLGFSDIVEFLARKLFGTGLISEERFRLIDNLVMSIRLPRIMVAALTGAALATSGAAYQAMFVNPLVSPGLLGVLAGSSFGAALGMLIFKSWYSIQISTFAGGFAAVGIAMLMARMHKSDSTIMLVLGGIISGALFTALLSVVKYLADPYSQLPAIVYWLMGNLSMSDTGTILKAGFPLCIGVLGIVFMSKHLNALSMGDEEAKTLGISVGRVRVLVIMCATLASSLSVVLAGQIGWVGLLVPHVVRMITGPDNATLVPVSALAGAAYLITVDDISRLAFAFEIPPGILTALMGIPCFVLVLGNARKGWR